MGIRFILGALALLFAVLLIILPGIRVAQGHLPPRRAIGLWISGAGFSFLAAAALALEGGGEVESAIFIGVVLAFVGSLVQGRLGKGPSR